MLIRRSTTMTKFCPNCGKEVNSNFCPYCGFDLTKIKLNETVTEPSAAETPAPETPVEETPVISFGTEQQAGPADTDPAPDFSFGSEQPQSESAQDFTFETPQPEPDPVPGFDFGSQTQDTQQNYNTYYIPPEPQKEPVTQRTWFVILFLLIFWPLGLFFMWKGKKFSKVARIIITAVVGVLFIINIIGIVAGFNAADEYYDDYDDYSYDYDYDSSDDYSYDSGTSDYSGGQLIDGRTAAEAAQSYLNALNFSREGLIEQLEYEGYSNSEATAAVDSMVVDWNAQAAGSARNYLNVFPDFTRTEMIDQLEYEGYTYSQAVYGADSVGL